MDRTLRSCYWILNGGSVKEKSNEDKRLMMVVVKQH